MKALSFIETLGEVDHQTLYKVWELKKFYSQPFDVGMLINPIGKPDFNKKIHLDNMDRTAGYTELNILQDERNKWKQAENKVLFDWSNDIFRINIVHTKGITLDEFLYKVKDLVEGIELHWKQSIMEKYFTDGK